MLGAQEEQEEKGHGRRKKVADQEEGARKKMKSLDAKILKKNKQGYFLLLPLSAGCTSNNVGCTYQLPLIILQNSGLSWFKYCQSTSFMDSDKTKCSYIVTSLFQDSDLKIKICLS